MYIRRLHAVLAALALAAAPLATAAERIGRAAAQAKCGQCHDANDWEGETQASLESLIRDIKRGAVSHKVKIELSDTEASDIAAYWAETSAQAAARKRK